MSPIAMRLVAALCCVTASVALVVGPNTQCDVTVDGNTYKQEVVAEDLDIPVNLVVDRQTNILYFTNYDERRNLYIPMQVNLNTKQQREIRELRGLCSFTVDQLHHLTYVGCLEHNDMGNAGLYQYDFSLARFALIGEKGKYIQSVFFKDVLYYSLHPSLRLYTFVGGRGAPVIELAAEVHGIVVDKDNDKIFYNGTGLYQQRSGSTEVVQYPGVNSTVSLAVDTLGDAYVCDFWRDSICRLDKSPVAATKVLDVSWCRGLAFDKDNNMIYSNSKNNKIYRLLKC